MARKQIWETFFRQVRKQWVAAASFSIITFSLFILVVAFYPQFLVELTKPSLNSERSLVGSFYKTANNIISICEGDYKWRDCYGKQLASVNGRTTFADTIKLLRQIEQYDDKTRDCHLIAHYIALSEVEKAPKDWINIFDVVDQTTCTNAFVHGALEGRSRYDTTLELNAQTIPQICNQIEDRTSRRVGKTRESADDACSHIIGHILLSQEGGDMKKAVDQCSKIPDDIKHSCYDGIFMENITRENMEAHQVAQKFPLTKTASLGLEENCKQFTGESGLSCWRELAHIYTAFTHNDPIPVHNLCYQSSNQQYAKECYMHSINLMILDESMDGKKLGDLCKPYFDDSDTVNYCIVRSLAPLLGSSVDFIDRADIFCQAVPAQSKNFCYSKVGEIIKPKASQEKRDQLCQKVPSEFYDYCIQKKHI